MRDHHLYGLRWQDALHISDVTCRVTVICRLSPRFFTDIHTYSYSSYFHNIPTYRSILKIVSALYLSIDATAKNLDPHHARFSWIQ